jgi:NDP-sugar pyrophosphorylase family protein
MKVIITTSGTGSRLGELTNYTNKSLINVGDKFAIDHILNNYINLKVSEFIITLGYYGDLVKQYLTLTYPDINFRFIWIDKYEGKGSSLGYSLLKVREFIDEPFIFHCCDCIIDNLPKFNQFMDILFVNNLKDGSSYASVTTSGEDIVKVNGKGENFFNYIYIGLSYIENHKKFFNILEDLYKTNPNNYSLSDIHVYMKMKNLKFIEIKDWSDTGNIKRYKQTCEKYGQKYDVLIKFNESLSFHGDKVIKFFHDKEKNKKRIARGKILKDMTPVILSESDNFHIMELIDSKPLSKIFQHKLIYKLLYWSKENLWVKNNNLDKEIFFNNCYKFYHDKTINRINKCLDEKKCVDYHKINNIEIGNIFDLIKKVDFNYLSNSEPCNYHGDFILDNILLKDDKFCLIDWREDFSGDLYNGDMYYDLAKLRHNIHFNHENINRGLFNIEEEKENINVDMKCNYYLINQLEDYERFIRENELDLKKIKILTAIIWINMSPLHEYPLSNFLFNFGKYNLHNIISN